MLRREPEDYMRRREFIKMAVQRLPGCSPKVLPQDPECSTI